MRCSIVAGLLLAVLPLCAPCDPAPPAQPDARRHWAFQQVRHATPPRVRRADWVRNPVDAFVLARLEKEGLEPAPEADRETLLRRVCFTLTGLPPTETERTAFLADRRPEAYERLVERLLASPHYGERAAQHWLDVVRYAESNGYEADGTRPHAWRYRDYVTRSFNADLPFDRFLTEQVCGDLLAATEQGERRKELLVAAGFHRCGPVHMVSGNIDPEVARQEVLTEMTSAIGFTFLGLTVNCARCHDHKFDPISQRGYYELEAFFAAAQPKDVEIATAEEKAAHGKRTGEINERIAPLKKQVEAIDAPHRLRLQAEKKAKLEQQYREVLDVPASKRTPEQQKLAAHANILIKVTWDEILAVLPPADAERRARLREQIHALQAQLPEPIPHAWTLTSAATTPPTHLLKRGSIKRKGDVVTPAFPEVLTALCPTPEGPLDRPALARWLTRPDHPLTARVLVNRLWQQHFGRGIVGTPNDFGTRGTPPSHPELLDWLAKEFIRKNWSIKELQRIIVLSSTFRQESRVRNPKAERLDGDNHLLWRQNRRRLDGEAIRDFALAVSGLLERKLGGPMVRIPLELEVYDLIFTEGEPDGLWHVTPDDREHHRRAVYLFRKRNVRLPMLEAFDQPDTLTSCPERPVSTFAPQALILLNGPFLQEQSRALSSRLLHAAGQDVERAVSKAHQLTLGREPVAEELTMARQFLAEQTALIRERMLAREKLNVPEELPPGIDPAYAAALSDYCLAMLNRNEFLYVR